MSDAGNSLLYPEDPGVTGALVPLRRDPSGGLHLAMPGVVHDVVNSAYNALVGPGEVLTGQTPTGAQASPSIPQIASDITGTMMGAGLGAPVEAGAFRTFGGATAKTFNPETAGLAQSMKAAGYGDSDIWRATQAADPEGRGYFFDKDSMLKHEIPDTGAQLKLEPKASGAPVSLEEHGVGPEGVPLGQIADLPAFQAYPDLAKNVIVKPMPEGVTALGDMLAKPDGTFELRLAPQSPESMLSTIHHEVQHGIQDTEGFARGADLNSLMPKNYNSLKSYASQLFWDAHDNAMAKGVLAEEESPEALRALRQSSSGQPLAPSQAKILANLSQDPNVFNDYVNAAQAFTKVQQMRDSAFDKYAAHGGEVESRNVQERFASGNYESHPWETQGYPQGPQIIKQRRSRGRVVGQQPAGSAGAFSFEPVAHDPFSGAALQPVDHDPFAGAP